MANPIIKKPGFDLDTYENLGDTESPTNRSWEVQTPTAQWKLESTLQQATSNVNIRQSHT